MPRDLSALRIFVAGPGDVDDERRQLEDVVEELNKTWADTLHVRLDLLTWRDHAVPGVGRDAQDVVNRSMPQDYDIFIGIMWSRFGSPTQRAGSGTEEEFNRALIRARTAPGSVHLMMYFKDDPVPMSAIDPEQVARIVAFRKHLEEEGVLYWTFTSPFEATVRVHLARQVQAWIAEHRKSQPENTGVRQSRSSEVEEPGLLDAADSFRGHMALVGEARTRITAAIIELHRVVIEQGPQIERTSGMDGVRKLMNWRAELLERLVKELNSEIPSMNQSFEAAMDNLGRTIALGREVGLGDALQSESWQVLLEHMRQTLNSDLDFLATFRATIADTGRFTTRLNRAKRAALAEIDRLIDAYRHQAETAEQVISRPPDAPTA